MPTKPRVGIFDFACCEGCQLTVLELDEKLLDVLPHIEIVTWREAISDQSDEYDVAIVEGSITRQQDIPRLQAIRERAAVLIALGSCATLGGVNSLKNQFPMSDVLNEVYGDQADLFRDTIPARPVQAVVPVDYYVHGCPINPLDFARVLQNALLGKPHVDSNRPVCFECKFKENVCVYEKNMACLGPVTRCGCDAICTSYGHGCFGCRGLIENPNVNSAKDVLDRYGYTVEEVLGRFRIYNNWFEPVKSQAEEG